MRHQVHNLFAIPVYQSKIKPLSSDTISKLIAFEWEDPGYDDSEPTHEETAERHILNLPQFADLKANIQEHVNHFVYELLGVSQKQQWDITTSWVNKSKPNNYHSAHWHSNSMVSGVIYLKTSQTSGALCFHKDRSHRTLWGDTLCIDFEKTTELNTEAVAFLPAINEILLFPSILTHSVLVNESPEDRYSLAFNVFPRGVLGAGGNSELTL